MIKNYSTKKSLIASAISLVLCLSMLVGTTFAWFTDSVTSENNIIKSGNIKVEMHWAQGKEDPSTANWHDASTGAIFDNEKWEPGYTEVRHIKIENKGSLALQYKLIIVANGEVSDLADVIDVYYLDPAAQVADRAQLTERNKLGTLTEVLANLDETGIGYLASGDSDTVTLALKMRESAGNEYQKASLCEGGFSVQLLATQAIGEFDSFGDDYDGNAVPDFFPGFQGGSAYASVVADDNGLTSAEVAMAGGDVSAIIPSGVKLADGVNSLKLTVGLKDTSNSNVQLSENEIMRPVDVHIEGVAEGNTTPMIITLKQYMTTGINAGAIKMYHVENGVAMPMTHVATPVNHNEFSYDPLTGDLTLALASFSEVAVIADTNNTWNGTAATSFTGGSGTKDDPYLIGSADQLAYFRDLVDGKQKAEGIDPSFAGKFVKLNNNIYLSNVNFDPIGWGYANESHNRKDAEGNPIEGKVFMGTFDGGQYDENGNLVGRYTIFDLRQSGWDLEDPDKDGVQDADYTYTNCGFGLFAAASGATFKNLTISGAYVRAECVEMGILVGLSQNNCTYNNIKILNSKIANYQRPAGGLIGEVSGNGTTTITNVTIGSDVVVGSLWGDFDAPCGGVIGARWKDDINADPQIVMTNVDVGCRLDVYNDITSAYQWHAYRRAGMLIGNTEMTVEGDPHKAAAPFLTCTKDAEGKPTVKVYYGDWVNYTYCNFSNHNPRYPWVRTQAGENCEAFSNPRWGVPNDMNDNRVTDMNHVHQEGDECNVLRQFSQLYGGGQGVYGQDEHDGVEVCKSYYSITYVNDGQTLDVIYVTDNTESVKVANDQAQKLVLEWAEKNIEGGTIAFGGWMNAASNKLTTIPAGNDKNIVLYPYFNSPYTASFVDQNGNILAWCLFNDSDVSRLQDAYALAKENLPNPGDDFELIHWVVRGTNLKDGSIKVDLANNNTNWDSFKGYKDVTITPHYRYKGADLIEVFDELTGEIDHYQAAGYGSGVVSTVVKLPESVNGKPVTEINANAFSSYDKLHVVVIPTTIETIGKKAISDQGDLFAKQETVTIYYEGSYEEWKSKGYGDDWITGLSEDSRVFFLNGGDTVDTNVYLEVEHKSYTIFGVGYIADYYFVEKSNTAGLVGDYYTNCKGCGVDGCEGNLRPDAIYWEALATAN